MTSPLNDKTLARVGLTCACLALQVNFSKRLSFLETSIFYQGRDLLKDEFFSEFYLILKEQVNEISSQREQVLRIYFSRGANQFNFTALENERFQQYLRKFDFFYRYYYISTYPNDLSLLSTKQSNMLAIRSLFLLYGS